MTVCVFFCVLGHFFPIREPENDLAFCADRFPNLSPFLYCKFPCVQPFVQKLGRPVKTGRQICFC